MKKQFTLFRMVFLLCAMIGGGVSPALAADEPDVTYDFTGSDWTVSNGVLSNGTVSFSGQGGNSFKMNSGYFIMGKSSAYINFPTYSSPVSKIVITGRSGASTDVKQNIFVGETAVSTETKGATGANTYEIASGQQAAGTQYTLKVTSNHNTQITKIEVYFGSSSDPSISANDASVLWNAEGGNIEYTISNPLNPEWEQVMMTTDSGDNWLQSGGYGNNGKLPFTVSTNYGDERSATVTLTYSYKLDSDNTVYQVNTTATVTQTAKPAPVITVEQDSYTMGKDETSIQIPYSIENANPSISLTVAIEGGANWPGLTTDLGNGIITITTAANSGPERTVNVVLGYPGAENKTVTLTQEGVIWPTVSFQANPAEGASVLNCTSNSNQLTSGSMIEPGSWVTLYVGLADNYEFDSWTDANDKLDFSNTTTTPGTDPKSVTLVFQMPEEDIDIVANLKSNCVNMTIDFESDATDYTDWTFTNIVSNYSNTGVNAHGGSKYGSTDGKASGSIQTKEKVNPASLTCYVSKQTTNTSTSTWYIHVSSDGSTWTEVANTDAKDMNKGKWKKFTAALSNYSDVYVRVSYSGSTAVRLIDDLTLEIKNDNRAEAELEFEEDEYSVELFNAASFNSPALTNPHELPITWTSSNETVARVNEGTVTILSEGETTITASFAGNDDYKPGEASYTLTVQDSRLEPTVTIHNTFITHTNIHEGTAAGTLTASVKYNDEPIEGATVTWSGDNDAVATINATHGYVDLVAVGTVTFTATYAGNANYKPAEASYVMTVTYSDPNAPGTVNNPYTVAQALENTPSSGTSDNVYIRGIVSAFYGDYTDITGDYSHRYYISDDGTTTNQLLVYNGKGLNNVAFSNASDLQIGDVVTILGGLTTYNSTKEVAKDNYIVSLKRARIIVDQTSYEADAKYTGTDDGYVSVTINFTHENVTMHGGNSQHTSDFNAVVMCDANGNPTTYDWLKFMIFVPEDNVGFFYFNDNNGAPRTAYLKLHGVDADGLDVYSELITITQDGVAINVDETEIEAPYTQIGGTIGVNYANFTPSYESLYVQFYDEDDNEINDCDWMSAVIDENDINTLNYFITTNDGDEERTAYLRVCWTAGTAPVVSDLITVTQAKPVETVTYTLAHSITPGMHYIIASGTDGNVYVMGGQKSTNREAVEVEITTKNVISVTDEKICEFIVSKDGAYYTFFDENLNGYLNATGAGGTNNNHLKTLGVNDNKGQWSISIDDGGVATVIANATGRNTMRFNNGNSKLFSCYSSGQQDIYLFEKDNDEGSLVIPIAAACTDGTKCYATFSSTKPFVVPEDLTVSEIGIDTDGTMNVENYETGAVVPANTGVMVSAAAGDRSYVANVSTEVGNNVLNGDNRLRPTGDDNGISANDMGTKDPDCLYYRLTMHNGTDIGFWWGNENGTAFAVGSNKAYLAVPASVAGARNGFAFGDDATGINNVNINLNDNDNCYDLQGRKVSTPGKGLYIVNGKKVVIK